MRRIVQFFFTGVILLVAGLAIWQVNTSGGDFLSTAERAWLHAHYRALSVAPDPRWTPSDLIEEQQIYQGISSDFMALIERKLGVRFLRLYTESWSQTMALEAQGKVDIHPVVFHSSGRDMDWLFTDAYMRIPVIAVMRSSLLAQFRPADIWTLRMSVGQGYGIEQFLRQHAEQALSLIPIESDRFGLIKAALGEVDVMVTDLASASYYIEQEGLTNLRLAATLGPLYEFRFASRRDQPLLHSILNKALGEITREERRRIYDRWIVFDTRPFYRSVTFWYVAGFTFLMVALVLTIILAWNAVLKVEVAHKTAALRDVQRELEQRVQRRTAELAAANVALESEMQARAKTAQDLLHVSGNERARIGRDLHDSVGQKLVGILYLTRILAAQLSDAQREEAAGAEKILDVVEASLTEMKQIVRGLLPVDILHKGFVAGLEGLLKETGQCHAIACRLICADHDATDGLDHALSTNLYRIAQEAISNALKHAESLGWIEVTLQVMPDCGILEITNDGVCHADVAFSKWETGMGMNIMHYRAMLAGGSLEVTPRPGGGTVVRCRFNPALKEVADGEAL